MTVKIMHYFYKHGKKLLGKTSVCMLATSVCGSSGMTPHDSQKPIGIVAVAVNPCLNPCFST